jgi:hypothetical protein
MLNGRAAPEKNARGPAKKKPVPLWKRWSGAPEARGFILA